MKFKKLIDGWSQERQRRQNLSGRIKEDLIRKGIRILRKYGIQKAVLFGSVADLTADENSDIDLLVLDLPKVEYCNFRYQLEQAVEHSMDIYSQDDDPRFVEKIMERGEVIYEVQH